MRPESPKSLPDDVENVAHVISLYGARDLYFSRRMTVLGRFVERQNSLRSPFRWTCEIVICLTQLRSNDT
jgi:hypothetical protein